MALTARSRDGRIRTPLHTGEDSHVKHSEAAALDINNIMAKYRKTGRLPQLIAQDARYGDFSTALDYQSSIEVVRKAEEQFLALPARVRERFHNNPSEMLAFVADPKNGDEAVKLGLATHRVGDATPSPANSSGTGGNQSTGVTPAQGGKGPAT